MSSRGGGVKSAQDFSPPSAMYALNWAAQQTGFLTWPPIGVGLVLTVLG